MEFFLFGFVLVFAFFCFNFVGVIGLSILSGFVLLNLLCLCVGLLFLLFLFFVGFALCQVCLLWMALILLSL